MVNRLAVPEVGSGKEILSVVAAPDGRLHFVLRTDQWEDPAAWGILLVDLARHVAQAYGRTTPSASAKALARVKAGFDAEWGDEG